MPREVQDHARPDRVPRDRRPRPARRDRHLELAQHVQRGDDVVRVLRVDHGLGHHAVVGRVGRVLRAASRRGVDRAAHDRPQRVRERRARGVGRPFRLADGSGALRLRRRRRAGAGPPRAVPVVLRGGGRGGVDLSGHVAIVAPSRPHLPARPPPDPRSAEVEPWSAEVEAWSVEVEGWSADVEAWSCQTARGHRSRPRLRPAWAPDARRRPVAHGGRVAAARRERTTPRVVRPGERRPRRDDAGRGGVVPRRDGPGGATRGTSGADGTRHHHPPRPPDATTRRRARETRLYLGRPRLYLGKPQLYLGRPQLYLGKPGLYLGRPGLYLGRPGRYPVSQRTSSGWSFLMVQTRCLRAATVVRARAATSTTTSTVTSRVTVAMLPP